MALARSIPLPGGQDVGVLLQHMTQHGVIIVIGYHGVDAASDLAERQLALADDGNQLLPGIDVILDRLVERQTDGIGLGSQCRRFIGGRETRLHHVDLEQINVVRELRQGAIDPHRFVGNQQGEVGVAHLGGEIAVCPLEGQLGVVQGFLCGGGLQL